MRFSEREIKAFLMRYEGKSRLGVAFDEEHPDYELADFLRKRRLIETVDSSSKDGDRFFLEQLTADGEDLIYELGFWPRIKRWFSRATEIAFIPLLVAIVGTLVTHFLIEALSQ
ncbi:MAG: hypothetical protein AAFR98_01960 [Pseudomonadota bacterium]